MKNIVLFLLVALLSLKTSAQQSLTCYSCGVGDPGGSFFTPCQNQITDSAVEKCSYLSRPEQGYTAICIVIIIFL